MGRVAKFEPFTLIIDQMVLLRGEERVRLGGRAFDVLRVLVENAGEVVTKDQLIALAWPGTTVDEGNLRVQVATVRKALGDGRYISNVSGRGYCFVAPVAWHDSDRPAEAEPQLPRPSLPLPTSLVGREKVVATIANELPEKRFVSIVGPGGIGKSSVALAVAHRLAPLLNGGAGFVDLLAVTEPSMISEAISLALGSRLEGQAGEAGLVDLLTGRDVLLVIDNCEHLIDAAATLCDRLVRRLPSLKVLATSRETMRVESEWVYRLEALALPTDGQVLSAEVAGRFSAVELFCQRAGAVSAGFILDDANAASIVAICRRLDGMPLAIELAAARVDIFGVQGIASRLDGVFDLLTHGRRGGLPRHQTIRATLDWSYGLLSEAEQRLLCWLSVFRGGFTAEDAAFVAGQAMPASVMDGLISLTAKSLIATDMSTGAPVHRMLELTRAYAAERLEDSGEQGAARRRHAEYFLARMEESRGDFQTLGKTRWLTRYSRSINDVRAAISWAFSDDGDALTGVALTTASIGLAEQLSLTREYRQRVEEALARLAQSGAADPRREMQLNFALGNLITQTSGDIPSMVAALEKASAIRARLEGDAEPDLVMGEWAAAFGYADYPRCIRLARRFAEIAASRNEPDLKVLADRIAAQSLHFSGEHQLAREKAMAVLASSVSYLPFSHVDRKVSMRIVLARASWMEGFAEDALDMAGEAVRYAKADNVVALCQALAFAAAPIAFWRGDLELARQRVDELHNAATGADLEYWTGWAARLEQIFAIKENSLTPAEVLSPLDDTLPPINDKLGDLLATIDARLVTRRQLERAESATSGWCVPEILRVWADALAQRSGADTKSKGFFDRALAESQRQGALAWELRAAMSMARHFPEAGRVALRRVQPLITQGRETADGSALIAATAAS